MKAIQAISADRIDNWPQALNTYINSVKDNKFEWGVHDCCTLVSGCVKAITGVDPMIEFRGKYDEATHKQALQDIGAGTIFKTLIKKFGKSTHGAMGQRGDIAFHDGRCGIIIGRQALFLYEEGYGLMPSKRVDRIFKVGRN